MRWLSFALLAGFTLCVQTTVARDLSVAGVYPDFMLILVVHYALHARGNDGLIAGWIAGLLIDLASAERLGVVATAYGLAALIVWSIRDLMFVRHPLSHLFVTAAFTFLVHLVLRLDHRIVNHAPTPVVRLLWLSLWTGIYTGLWAVIIHQVLLRISRTLGLQPSRNRMFDKPRQVS